MTGKREDYTSIVHYVSMRGAVSFHRARTTISELGKVLKNAALRGDDLHIPGVFKIEYRATKGYIYNNKVYGLEEQYKEVAKNLQMPEAEVRKLIQLYYRRIKDLIEIGYHVNVKGIGYVIPKQDDYGVYCDTRVSPVLNKPDIADFVVMGEDGTLDIKQLTEQELRYSIELVEGFNIPYQVLKNVELKLEEVDI